MRFSFVVVFALTIAISCTSFAANESSKEWKPLDTSASFSGWREDHQGWTTANEASLDPTEPKHLRTTPGDKILVSAGEGANLLSAEDFQDVEVRLEFMIPKDANSGVKLNGLYEIQIIDSYGKKKLRGDDCGGVYPRGENEPDYHVIDEGFPPRVNAAKPAGEWQTLQIGFKGPRFDEAGKKTSNAKFTRVVLNDKVIHENVELPCPTGANWRLAPEVARGPLMLQGDHGPVAFRNIAVRPSN